MKVRVLVILLLLEVGLRCQEESFRSGCLTIEKSLCFGGSKSEISLEGNVEGLIGHWRFDDVNGMDSSFVKNDMVGRVQVGPSMPGFGSSGYYSIEERTNTSIGHDDQYDQQQLTISFWIFLIKEPTSSWRNIMHKGGSSSELTPQILLWPNQNRFHVRVSTDWGWNENMDSNGVIVVRRWNHVTLTISNLMIQLYINGNLDSQKILNGQVVYNRGPITLGQTEYHQTATFYIDDLRIYNKILPKSEILSLSETSSLIFSGNNIAALGCGSCTYSKAVTSCVDGYHLCSFQEIYSGAYQYARIQGWFRQNSHFWVKYPDDSPEQLINQELYDPNIYKLAICCINAE